MWQINSAEKELKPITFQELLSYLNSKRRKKKPMSRNENIECQQNTISASRTDIACSHPQVSSGRDPFKIVQELLVALLHIRMAYRPIYSPRPELRPQHFRRFISLARQPHHTRVQCTLLLCLPSSYRLPNPMWAY